MIDTYMYEVEDYGCEIPFFDIYETPKTEHECKVYNDGGHYIATRNIRSNLNIKRKKTEKKDIDKLFIALYKTAIEQGLNGKETLEYIRNELQNAFPDYKKLDEYIAKSIEKQRKNLYARKKRFRRKANLNKWNYFVTFTYDDKKHNAETFRKKLRCCLSHLHTRRGWRYMGVFEKAPETGRLHFHGLFYIPDGEMIGTITKKEDYSTAQHKMQITNENDFFQKKFGRNDFGVINEMELRHGQTLKYLLKYIEKTGERIVYSRGILTEFICKIKNSDIITKMKDYVTKYILFDDAINWERDIMHFTYKQMTMFNFIRS